MDGEIVVNRWARLAVERHFNDIETGGERGIYFDADRAEHALRFFGFLKHSKGKWAGRSFELAPFQQFEIASIFGWMRDDGLRRFRHVYDEEPRKNGKTTKIAGVGIYLFFADGESGSEVYSAATKRDQALISHAEAVRMIRSSPGLNKRIGLFKDNIHYPKHAPNCSFKPLGANADSLDGLNPHGVLIDEFHAHKSRDLVEVLETATGAREQPLIYKITTAGFNRMGVCYEHREYLTKILEGHFQDDSVFGIIHTIDDGDDWTQESAWRKANPNYGVSIQRDQFAEEARKAERMQSYQMAFLTKRLNVWCSAARAWLSVDDWMLGARDDFRISDYTGLPCWIGIDLSSKRDITAVSFIWKIESVYHIYTVFFCPGEQVERRSDLAQLPYAEWVEKGFLIPTEGNKIDEAFIRHEINRLTHENSLDVQEVAFDPWNASQLVTDLQDDGFECVEVRQGFASLSSPSKEFEAAIVDGKIVHSNNAVMNWMVSNCVVRSDPADNIKPDKSKSAEKIDGVVSTITALGRVMVGGDGHGRSIYESSVF